MDRRASSTIHWPAPEATGVLCIARAPKQDHRINLRMAAGDRSGEHMQVDKCRL